MKISIAMAMYNGAAHLKAQLDSFAQQTRRPDELVVSDDHSADSSIDIVRAFAAAAQFPVRLEVNAQRLGFMRNFGRALELCTGDLVLLSDQDDVWLPGKIEALERQATQNPSKGCVINDAWLTDGTLAPVGTTKMGQIKAAGLPLTAMVQGCCSGFRRALLASLLPIPHDQKAHDNWLVQMADLLGQTIRLQEPLQYYRRHGGNASNSSVNRLDSPGRWLRIRDSVVGIMRRTSSMDGLEAELHFYESAVQRMHERHADLLHAVGADALHEALRLANAKLSILGRRRAIHGMTRRTRMSHVWRLWREGGYERPGRFASAVKDLLFVVGEKANRP